MISPYVMSIYIRNYFMEKGTLSGILQDPIVADNIGSFAQHAKMSKIELCHTVIPILKTNFKKNDKPDFDKYIEDGSVQSAARLLVPVLELLVDTEEYLSKFQGMNRLAFVAEDNSEIVELLRSAVKIKRMKTQNIVRFLNGVLQIPDRLTEEQEEDIFRRVPIAMVLPKATLSTTLFLEGSFLRYATTPFNTFGWTHGGLELLSYLSMTVGQSVKEFIVSNGFIFQSITESVKEGYIIYPDGEKVGVILSDMPDSDAVAVISESTLQRISKKDFEDVTYGEDTLLIKMKPVKFDNVMKYKGSPVVFLEEGRVVTLTGKRPNDSNLVSEVEVSEILYKGILGGN